ncbi:MAG: radical SAM family heme chaperone HemW [Acidobacteria bacterium]|nr:radical SAM family heme chaperone HemW [Acidobacteriota bacterium]MBS1865272.1 radical SAM family heme chaperone HemW [Acidobacteriota bacterium]
MSILHAKIKRETMNLGVYIQVPFCQTKCTYCNFHTGVVAADRYAPYAFAVQAEIANHRDLYASSGIPESQIQNAVVDTVYFGGGTPSLLDPGHLRGILDAIRRTFTCEFAEVTLEADPETVTAGKAAAWADAGINRVSFGVQSFSDLELKSSGRMHRREDVYRAASILRAAGLHNLSFDLIIGLPHQTAATWRNSLDELVALTPEHVSIYMLEVDEGSRLGRELLSLGTKYSAPAVPTDDQMADSYDLACSLLSVAGFNHYEISNWAKPGRASRHNLKYWRREPYLGFGAGAHSFSGSTRWANVHDSAQYVAALESGYLPAEQIEAVSVKQAQEEEIFLGLRQLNGINLDQIEPAYAASLSEKFVTLQSAGLIEREGNIVRLAPKKLSISNEVFVELLS